MILYLYLAWSFGWALSDAINFSRSKHGHLVGALSLVLIISFFLWPVIALRAIVLFLIPKKAVYDEDKCAKYN